MMRIKFEKYSQKYLTRELVGTNIYTNEMKKMFAYSEEEAECLLKEKT